MLSKTLGVIGRLLIVAGAVVLGFVAFQLWGTGLEESRQQDQLLDEFAEQLGAAQGSELTELTGETGTTGVVGTTGPPPTPAPGEPAGVIEIPRIDLARVMVEGTTRADLKKGPGHYTGTPFPGQSGNVGVAGHRTTYGAPFNRIDELLPGDEIIASTSQGRFTYRVIPAPDTPSQAWYTVKPSQTEVLDNFGDNRITLTACHPKYSARQRIIVHAVLEEAPVEASPVVAEPSDVQESVADDFEEGLGSTPSELPVALGYGGAAAALVLGAWLITAQHQARMGGLVGGDASGAAPGLERVRPHGPLPPRHLSDLWHWSPRQPDLGGDSRRPPTPNPPVRRDGRAPDSGPPELGGTPLAERPAALGEVVRGPCPLEHGSIDAFGIGVAGWTLQQIESELRPCEGERGQGHDVARQSIGVGEDLCLGIVSLGLDQTLDQADINGVTGTDGLHGEQHPSGRRVAGIQCQTLDRPVVDHEAEFRNRYCETGVGRGDPKVTGERDLHPEPHARSSDGRHCGARQGGQVVQGGPKRLGEGQVLQFVQIRAGTEVAGITGDHYATHLLLCCTLHGGVQLLECGVIEGVATLGA